MSAAGRGKKKRVRNDFYPTPQALADFLVGLLPELPSDKVSWILEPSAGRGNWVEALRRRYPAARIVAVEPYLRQRKGLARRGADAVVPERFERYAAKQDALKCRGKILIVGNPPYLMAEEHVRLAIGRLQPGGTLAFLLRLGFLESRARIPFWREHPAEDIYVVSERPSFVRGKTDQTSYALFTWRRPDERRGATRLHVVSWKTPTEIPLATTRTVALPADWQLDCACHGCGYAQKHCVCEGRPRRTA